MAFWDGTRWIDASSAASRARRQRHPGRMGRLGDTVATFAMVLGLAALAIPFVSTRATEPTLTLSPDSGAAGSSVQVTGTAVSGSRRLQITWDGVASGMPTVRVTNGTFRTTIVVPNAAEGAHTIAATDRTTKGGKVAGKQASPFVGATFRLTARAEEQPPVTPGPTTAPDPTAEPTTAPPPPTPTDPASPTDPPSPAPAPTSNVTPAPPPTPAPTSTAPPPDPLTGFVRATGTRLTLNGEPYRFKGFNIYNANSRDNCWYPLGYDNNALGNALIAVGPGQNAFRAWFFQDLATTNGKRDWSAFDHTIAVAREHNVRIVATLADQWGSCDSGPGGAVFKGDAWYTSDYRSVVAPGSTRPYRDWVAEVVTRYRNEPAILGWQLMNEAEIRRDINSSCTAGGAAILKTWAADVSSLVKALDANHLVSLGTLGGGQCGMQGDEYRSIHNLATIDLCEYHDYLPEAMPGDQWNGLALRLSQCAALGKPLFVGETGQRDMSLSARADLFALKFATQFGAGVVGELIWALRIESQGGSSTTNYDMGPDDPAVSLFARY
jgi:hypothetical protein